MKQSTKRRVVLHVITALKSGGAENMLALLIENNTSEVIEHVVVSIRPEGVNRKRIEKAGCKVIDLNVTSALKLVNGLLKLVKIIRTLKPQVVQGWMYHGDLFSTLALKLSRRRKWTKLFWGVRCSNLDFNQYSRQLRMVIKMCIKLSKNADLIIANSNSGIESHQQIGYFKERFRLVENGVDATKFSANKNIRIKVRNKLGIDADAIVAIVSARNDPMKDYPNILAAVKNIDNVLLLIVGSGTGSCRNKIK